MALTHLRGNPFIDYKQLGLRHILYAWEVRGRQQRAQQPVPLLGGSPGVQLVTRELFKAAQDNTKRTLLALFGFFFKGI